jgi:hypothetical protein
MTQYAHCSTKTTARHLVGGFSISASQANASPGKDWRREFDRLPDPPEYFRVNADMIFDPSKSRRQRTYHLGWNRARSLSFRISPRAHSEGFEWQDITALDRPERIAFLEKLSKAVKEDARCMRLIMRRLEDAKVLAENRIRWNFKTGIPQYYPRYDLMSFLLALALINDEIVDIALVVTRSESGSYLGRTILPLNWPTKTIVWYAGLIATGWPRRRFKLASISKRTKEQRNRQAVQLSNLRPPACKAEDRRRYRCMGGGTPPEGASLRP